MLQDQNLTNSKVDQLQKELSLLRKAVAALQAANSNVQASVSITGNNGGVVNLASDYTTSVLDSGKLLSCNPSANMTIKLPSTPPGVNWAISIENISASFTVTIDPNTSAIDSSTSAIVLSKNQGVDIYTDGATYKTQRGISSVPLILQVSGVANGSQTKLNLIPGSNVTITDGGTGGVTIAASASVPTVYGSGAGGGSPFVTFTKPTVSQFSLNSATATVADTTTGITVTGAVNTSASYTRSAGLTAPFNIEIGFIGIIGPENASGIYLLGRNGAAGTGFGFGLINNTGLKLELLQLTTTLSTNALSFSATSAFMASGIPIYLRIRDDGTTRYFEVSPDLILWSTIVSHARTTYSVIDRGGFVIQGSTSYMPCARIVHYREY